MGYGLGAFLLVVGLVLALAVQDSINEVDLQMAGWICALVGLGAIILSAVTMNSGRRARSTATTVHPDGSQTVSERRTEI
ncbi:MAG: hypothetical protein JWM84_396 [Nocardioides sp.]|nr:hypothetical protein [Nocardioides sp.]